MNPRTSLIARRGLWAAAAMVALCASVGALWAAETNGAGAAAQPPAAVPQATNSAAPRNATAGGPVTLDTFRIISERNIFNPNRVGRTARGPEAAPAPRFDAIALVGTMESEQGVRAFFDSSEPAFRKAARTGDTIADFTVAQIAPDGVVLTREGKQVPLKVTQQLRRPNGGEWSVSGADPAALRPASAPSADPEAPARIPAGASDVLRRLMEQRQKQLKQ